MANEPPRRKTRQAAAIQDALRAAERPLTVQELHLAAQANANLGIATVYRAIKRLLAEGEISEVQLPYGPIRYETTNNCHHHFQCHSCDTVFCLKHIPLDLPKNARLPGGFVVHSHNMTLYGLCGACQERCDSASADGEKLCG